MIMLGKEQIKRLYWKLLDATGGSDGIRDEALLDSALSSAFQTFDGIELYPSTTSKITRIAYNLVCNHPIPGANLMVVPLDCLLISSIRQLPQKVHFSVVPLFHMYHHKCQLSSLFQSLDAPVYENDSRSNGSSNFRHR